MEIEDENLVWEYVHPVQSFHIRYKHLRVKLLETFCMRTIHIEAASEHDVPVLAILNKRLIEDEHYPNPMNINQLEERMKKWLRNEYLAYTIKENHEILGYCLFRDDGDFYYMRQLYIDRPHRRKGLATKLLDWMYAHIWIDKKTRLDVLPDNAQAIEFYTSYGFKTRCFNLEK